MQIDIGTAAEGIGGAVTAIGGLYGAAKHFINRYKKHKEKYREDVLKEARADLDRVSLALEERIKGLAVELATQKNNVSRDLSHLREVYNAEIKVLGDKIDSLRSDLQDQHSSMVALLTKLVDSR